MDFELKIVRNEINFEDFLQKNLANIKSIITDSLYIIEGAAKANCPVDTGDLRQAIQAAPFSDAIGGRVECAENRTPPIGAYVEFGTGANVQIPEGLEDYAMGFFVSGKGHLPARPFLFPAFFAEQDSLLERLKSS